MTTAHAPAVDSVGCCGSARCVPELDLAGLESELRSGAGLDAGGLATVFHALGSPVRLRLLAIVQAAPHGEACVCELVDRVGVGQSTVSHHLGVLVASGLLRREQRGTWAWYALVPDRLDAARRLIG